MNSCVVALLAIAALVSFNARDCFSAGDLIYSESGKLKIEIVRIPEKNEAWLVSSRNPSERTLLYRFTRDIDAVFSPDDSRIALVDWAGSDYAKVVVFQRKGVGLSYAALKDDLETPAWKACIASLGIGSANAFANRHTIALAWSGDSGAILLRLTGMLNTGEMLSAFHCVYDFGTRQVGMDLNRMNKGALTRRE
ncbi:hypothetical protein [Fundidesulfovibrio putealis]|uniref:hypothetical protein n=1 Tax=Fundidesulfovibrio putealis TaxID=270496 RepID=UPI0003FD926C|nr:hypothetical protein [Fundidesulfovibrio putealis]